jgi:hypothetical protein
MDGIGFFFYRDNFCLLLAMIGTVRHNHCNLVMSFFVVRMNRSGLSQLCTITEKLAKGQISPF